jgi:orotidine-5'-phosphate decarboxylase
VKKRRAPCDSTTFSDRLTTAIGKKGSAVVVGLDPQLELLPPAMLSSLRSQSSNDPLDAAANIVLDFNKLVIEAVHDLVPAVKPQIAFYERLGIPGMHALAQTIDFAHQRDLIVILDAKRNDISSTATAYAEAFIGRSEIPGFADPIEIFGVDAITINPYLGSDGIYPFINTAMNYGRGLFVLVKTSNPSSVEFQDLLVYNKGENHGKLSHAVARKVAEWGESSLGRCGYSQVGAVVGATFPTEAMELRNIMPKAIFLVPGIGTQGGEPQNVSCFFRGDGLGAIISASRSLIYAYRLPRYSKLSIENAIRRATQDLSQEVERAREIAQSS